MKKAFLTACSLALLLVSCKKDDNTNANHRKADIWIKFPHNQFYVKTKLQKRFG